MMMLLGHGVRDRGMLKGSERCLWGFHHDLGMAVPLSELDNPGVGLLAVCGSQWRNAFYLNSAHSSSIWPMDSHPMKLSWPGKGPFHPPCMPCPHTLCLLNQDSSEYREGSKISRQPVPLWRPLPTLLLPAFLSYGSRKAVVVAQSLSHVWLFVTPWTVALQAPVSSTTSLSLLKFMSIESMMPSNHLSLCRPLLLLPLVSPSIRVFSNELALHMRCPEDWSFSFSISPYNEYSGLISFRIDWLDLLAVQGSFKSLL